MRYLALLLALVLVVPAAQATEPPTKDHHNTLVNVVTSTDALSTLETAVVTAGLADALSGDGPFTVFAPANSAFEALPAGTVQSLLQENNRALLTSILTYHVVAGELNAADLTNGQTLETLNGAELTVSLLNGKVYIVDAAGNAAEVVMADVEADNGVAHVINAVLMPPM
jgi:uncharacterized surface protein with fasciclin (FAS1) repeats